MIIKSGIYAITNTINGKTYVGSTIDLERRQKDHNNNLCNGTHPNPHLQYSWNKYGESVFEFKVLEYIDSSDDLLKAEQSWLNVYKAGGKGVYNIALATDCPMRGRKHSKETRRKLSKTSTGNTNALGCKHFGGPSGYRHTKEAKHKIRMAQVGRKHTKETRLKMSKSATARWARVREEANREE